MNHLRLWLVLALCVSGPVAAKNRSQASPTLPKNIGKVYLLGQKGLYPMERQTPKISNRGIGKSVVTGLLTAGLYHSKAKTVYVVEGRSSPTIIEVENPQFIVRLGRGMDGSEFALYPMVVKKNERWIQIASTGGVFGASVQAGVDTIPLDVSPHPDDEDVVVLVPSKDLPPGEYAVSASGSSEVFCFSIMDRRAGEYEQ